MHIEKQARALCQIPGTMSYQEVCDSVSLFRGIASASVTMCIFEYLFEWIIIQYYYTMNILKFTNYFYPSRIIFLIQLFFLVIKSGGVDYLKFSVSIRDLCIN